MLSGTLFSRTLPFLVGSPSFFCAVDQWSHRISKGRFWNRLFTMALEWWAGGQVLGGCYSTEDTRSPVTLPQEKARNWTSFWVGFCEAYFKKTCWFLAPRCCSSPVPFFRKCSPILRRVGGHSWQGTFLELLLALKCGRNIAPQCPYRRPSSWGNVKGPAREQRWNVTFHGYSGGRLPVADRLCKQPSWEGSTDTRTFPSSINSFLSSFTCHRFNIV